MGLKKGWFFTSLAPAREPRRRTSSLIRSLRMTDLHRLQVLDFVMDGVMGLTLRLVSLLRVLGMALRHGGCLRMLRCGFCP